jgi:hypothetical protein
MKRRTPPENTPRVIATAIAFFGAAAAFAWASGVFALLADEELLALVAFAVAFALLTYFEDRGVRAAVNRAFGALRFRSAGPARSPAGRRVAP